NRSGRLPPGTTASTRCPSSATPERRGLAGAEGRGTALPAPGARTPQWRRAPTPVAASVPTGVLGQVRVLVPFSLGDGEQVTRRTVHGASSNLLPIPGRTEQE